MQAFSLEVDFTSNSYSTLKNNNFTEKKFTTRTSLIGTFSY